MSAKESKGAKLAYDPPVIEKLDQYEDVDLTNLVTYPPKLQPIPVKPLFFDLAWNYIDYPGRTPGDVNGVSAGEDGPRSAVEEKQEARKGWFGFGR